MAKPSAPWSANTWADLTLRTTIPSYREWGGRLQSLSYHIPTLNVVTYICLVTIEDHLDQPGFKDHGQKLHMHILVVARQLDLLSRRILKPHGITPPQYNVLRILRGQRGEPIAVQSLSARMVDPSSNTSRIVDKLVEKGWADRKVCPTDRRRADVSITYAGMNVLEGLDHPVDSMFRQSLEGVDETRLRQLNTGLARMLNNTDEIIEVQH